MKPRFGNYRFLMQFPVNNIAGASFYPMVEMFGICLLHHAKAPEFSFCVVVIAVVVFV